MVGRQEEGEGEGMAGRGEEEGREQALRTNPSSRGWPGEQTPTQHPLTSLSLFTPSELSPPQSHHTGCSVCLARSSPAFGELGSPNSGLSAEVALQAAPPTQGRAAPAPPHPVLPLEHL